MSQANSEVRRVPGSAVRAIERPSLREMAVEQVREAIQRGDLKAGERLTELGLARDLGVAQATVREALVELEHQGFIERRGPRQMSVTALTPKQINDIYAVRMRLETLAAELLAAAEHPDLDGADREYRKMLRAAESEDYIEYFRADLNFHRSLWRATGNQSLYELLDRLVPKLFAFGIIQQHRPAADLVEAAVTDHGALLELIRSRKCTEAVDVTVAAIRRAVSWTDGQAETK